MKHVIILRGLPGSGKSYFSKMIREAVVSPISVRHISMDFYWTRDGQPYRFNKDEISDAVRWTRHQFDLAMDDPEVQIVIVDNTHTRLWEMDYYCGKQMRHYYSEAVFIVLHVEDTLQRCVARGQHGVSVEKILDMRDRFEPLCPAPHQIEDRIRSLEIAVLSK